MPSGHAPKRKKTVQDELRGADRIERRVGKVIGKFKVGKHFLTETADTSFTYRRNEESISAEQALDGLYIVRTNAEPALLSTEQTVRAYKSLSTVERAFRSMKAVDLRVRPIFHRKPERVRAHIFLCMLAYYGEWHLRQALAPLLFQDEDPETGDRERSSPVKQARRSPEARRKVAARQTPEGFPLHDFGTLLQNLGTLTRNTVRTPANDATFTLRAKPTPLQRKAFALLDLSPSLQPGAARRRTPAIPLRPKNAKGSLPSSFWNFRLMARVVQEILRRHGASQARMAAAIGMSPNQLSRKISGERRTQVEEAQSIAAYLSRNSGQVTS